MRAVAVVGSLFALGPHEAARLMGPAAPLAFAATDVEFSEQYAAFASHPGEPHGDRAHPAR